MMKVCKYPFAESLTMSVGLTNDEIDEVALLPVANCCDNGDVWVDVYNYKELSELQKSSMVDYILEFASEGVTTLYFFKQKGEDCEFW